MNEWQVVEWLGVLGTLVVIGTLGYWVSAVIRVRVPTNLNPIRGALVVGGLACLATGVASPSTALSVMGFVGFALAFLFLSLDRIATLPRQRPSVEVGSPVPAFSSPTSEGDTFELLIPPGRPLLLKFFRGHW